MEGRIRSHTLIAALALMSGCEKLLGLEPVEPPFAAAAGGATVAAGLGHTCWIDSTGALWCWGENDDGELGNGSTQGEIDTLAPIDDQTWLQVSAKHRHTCAIRADHTLWCWGASANGRLGLGLQVNDHYATPQQITAASAWSSVSAGSYHSCAIDDQHGLWCWGYDSNGQLGDNGFDNQYSPVAIGGGYAAVAVALYHSCGIKTGGTLWCWGYNGHGQLGDSTFTQHRMPVQIGTEAWSAIAVGDEHTCGITATGHLRCWGQNHVGQLGLPLTGDEPSPMTVFAGGDDRADWAGVAANRHHTCAWTTGGLAFCFGDSSHGELGPNGVTVNSTPIAMSTDVMWSGFAMGERHMCGFDKSRQLSCGGSNGWGELGSGAHATLQPAPVGSSTWGNVYAGTTSTCVLDGVQHANCGGNNFFGQLGDATQTSRAALAPAAGGTAFSSLALGDNVALGFESNAMPVLFTWGDDEDGQGAQPPDSPILSPTASSVMATDGAIMQASASDHACAIVNTAASGIVMYCWGNNDHGQLGDGTTMERDTPVVVPKPAMGAWNRVACGTQFTCATDSANELFCWGRGEHGLIGINDANQTDRHAPTLVAPMGSYATIFAGVDHACALETGSTSRAWCWGYNGEGQLGFTGGDVLMPALSSSKTWDRLALGADHTCAVEHTTNLLWCWGDNRRGQLGTPGTARNSVNSPTQIGTIQWASIAAGAWHTCAVSGQGQLYCWGADDDGQLLDGAGWQAQMMMVGVRP
jgi:alpha-tubulin suppressor-like RCC1 family protein